MTLKITTNNQWRQFVYRYDVPEKVLNSQFDYHDPDEVLDGYFCYKGVWYHLDQFMRTEFGKLKELGWDGLHSDSFFSGVAIRLSSDGETFQVATIIA